MTPPSTTLDRKTLRKILDQHVPTVKICALTNLTNFGVTKRARRLGIEPALKIGRANIYTRAHAIRIIMDK